jgi:cellulose synthase/poly-beta-1,6-N-acetylglucosamine synthase-like glycosyltransferase
MHQVMFSGVVIAIVCVPAFLVFVWFSQIVAGCFALRRKGLSPTAAPVALFRTTVLIPAHDEGSGILATLADVRAQLGPHDNVLVVADNCTDETAEIVKAAGVDVAIRVDPTRRGKGYALEFGVRHLAINPPDVVVVLDADCRLGEGALLRLSGHAMQKGRPAQCLYLMLAPENAGAGNKVSVFAWRVKNWIRPLGLRLFGLPTQLFGTGMAFPFNLVLERDLGNSRLAEDTAVGMSLAAAGYPPYFVSEAKVYSHFPVSQAGSEQQRLRWEKGHIDNIIDLVPGALAKSFRDGNLALAALAIDMTIPPLSLLVFIVVFCEIFAGVLVALGTSFMALAISSASILLLVFGTMLAWTTVGRDVLPFRDLLRLPLYAIRKIGMYRSISTGKAASSWIRTDRMKAPADENFEG